jgi:hypothetical protein
MTFQLDFSVVLALFFGLALFGVGFNALVSWLENNGFLEGFTWLAVVFGVLVTLGGVAVVSWGSALLALGCFAASGSPMALGAILRYVRARKDAQMQTRRVAARIAMLGEVADEVHPS